MDFFLENFWKEEYFGNIIKQYVIALGLFLGFSSIVKIVAALLLRKLKKWAEKSLNTWDDLIVYSIEKNGIPLIYLGIFERCLNTLYITPYGKKVLHVFYTAFITFFVVRQIVNIVRHTLDYYFNRNFDSNSSAPKKQIGGMMTLINILIWTIGFIFLFDNLGFHMQSVITGLGIGGLAIAIAAQTILGDVFSHFVILFDRPFEIGDTISIDNKSGTVEYIGIRSTLITSTTGEQLVFSNKDLTNARLHNFQKMEKRRILIQIGVTYQTPLDKLKTITSLIQTIIEEQENVTFERGNLSNFGDFSIQFEFVAFIHNHEYKIFMDAKEKILLTICEIFEKEKIEFAYPTQTLFLNPSEIQSNKNINVG